VTACRHYEDRLGRFHDGELGSWARFWTGRHLGRCGGCREELSLLQHMGGLLREREEAAPGVDLWAGIAARLPGVDADLVGRTAPSARRERRPRSRVWPVPLGVGGLAAATVAAVLLVGPGPPPLDDTVEEIDSMGRQVAVLPSDGQSTIIWVMDPPRGGSGEEVERERL